MNHYIVESEKFGIKIYTVMDNDIKYFDFVRVSELPNLDEEDFSKFMYGQTMPYFQEYRDAIYYHDYIRYLRHKQGKPIIFD